ncbi:PAS domain-containing hybrid sensor histidine kinase/response regulator [Aestuariibacter salexigens]|uniref:PAS domain-containing hybrid sensor histidine kinase/response regulator n=1 Tax=Aestuariibacter salexigens TaxID=226010 RepID=UPI0003F8409A|nr:PAS domain-containing hybrid sensor histidine kinase/response regulator [Aestuariibacter salexigens]
MAFGWVFLALLYLFGLFWIARWGDKNSHSARWLTSHPAIYSLALAIYCTAWTFFGAVGSSVQDPWGYLPILLGPAIIYLFGYRFLYKLLLVSKKQHINTIADFIASRYGKRQAVALLVTLIALLATVPYIALQLKAIGSAFQLVSEQAHGDLIVVLATLFIAIFAIYFGTQQTDVTQYRRGLMLAIAFESTVKLCALVLVAAVAFFTWHSMNDQPIMATYTTPEAISTLQTVPFWAQTLMAGLAVICLPRQFHVGFVDNVNPEHLKTARWLFPLYLFITASVIPIIAVVGSGLFAGTSIEPDNYVLSVAIFSESALLKMLVFLGGLSAATAMIIVATLTLSTMLTNDVVLPKLLALKQHEHKTASYTRKILIIRRVIIGLILMLALLYQHQMANSRTLASIGLIAFSLVIQLIPAIVGGLYWKCGHAHGVYAGLLVGLISWVLFSILPMLGEGVTLQAQTDILTQGAIISLVANAVAYIVFSLWAQARLIDRIQAEAFVYPAETRSNAIKKHNESVTVGDLLTLLTTFMGSSRCEQIIEEFELRTDKKLQDNEHPDQQFLAFCERALGGVIGASSAKALIDSVIRGKKLDFAEVINFFDDTTQAMQFNMTALLTSLENIDQGISVIDKNLKLVAWNKRYASLFNYPPELLQVGTPIEKLVRYNAARGECGPGELEEIVQKRLDHLQKSNPHRFTRQRSDGKVIEMTGNPLPGGGFVTTFNDITGHIEIQQALEESNIDLEHRIKKRTEEVHSINAELRLEIERRAEAEKELIRARQAAEEANASKTRFLALASHDILQPLNAAKLYTTALQEAELSDNNKQILRKLNDSVSSTEALIATLLDISRLDQGEMRPNIESLDLSAVLGPLIDEFSMQAQDKGLQLNARLRHYWIKADRTFVYRIVQNLLSNALKYTAEGKILLTARKVNETIIVQVRDTGIGIAPEQQKKVFADFYRAEQGMAHGVGLGLGVVTRLAGQLGCKVEVDSVPGRGSCFSVSLPACPAGLSAAPQKRKSDAAFDGLRALCVDDQRENLDAMQTLLEKWHIDVTVTDNWDEALSLAASSDPQVLLIDYQLSEQHNGLDLIDTIRKRLDSGIPAALVTANREEELIEKCKAQSVNYLNKPVKPAKLRALLQSMTRQVKKLPTK